jgi:hypothetical protein
MLTGLILLALAVAFLADASGAWRLTPQRAAPLVAGGLAMAAVTGLVGRSVRGRARDRTPGDRLAEDRMAGDRLADGWTSGGRMPRVRTARAARRAARGRSRGRR